MRPVTRRRSGSSSRVAIAAARAVASPGGTAIPDSPTSSGGCPGIAHHAGEAAGHRFGHRETEGLVAHRRRDEQVGRPVAVHERVVRHRADDPHPRSKIGGQTAEDRLEIAAPGSKRPPRPIERALAVEGEGPFERRRALQEGEERVRHQPGLTHELELECLTIAREPGEGVDQDVHPFFGRDPADEQEALARRRRVHVVVRCEPVEIDAVADRDDPPGVLGEARRQAAGEPRAHGDDRGGRPEPGRSRGAVEPDQELVVEVEHERDAG